MAWRRKIDWSQHGDEIIELYVSGMSAREVVIVVNERHGITYHSGTLTHFLGHKGVLRSKVEAHKLAVAKTVRICETCDNGFTPRNYNQRWCDECTGVRKHINRVRSHGLPAVIIERVFERQSKRCAICGKQFGDMFSVKHKKSLFVDHDHATNQFRGLLCVRCNNGLSFLDDVTWNDAARRYLIIAQSDADPVYVNPPRKRRYVRNKPIMIAA